MKIMRAMLVVLAAMVSMIASAQSSEIDKIIDKYKNQEDVLYTERRNPDTGEVTKKEIIVTIKGAADVKSLYNAVENLMNKGKGITDVTKTKKMLEVKCINGDRAYSIMVSKKNDEEASLIYNERPAAKKRAQDKWREGLEALEEMNSK